MFHYVDHFSKFSVLRGIPDKSAESISAVLTEIWTLMGPPDILQSDNGKEFDNLAVKVLCEQFSVTHIFGRAHHPQTQGVVERANQFAKRKLQAWSSEQPAGADWLPALAYVQMEMNRAPRRSIRQSPFELVFNRKQSTDKERQLLLGGQQTQLLQLLSSSDEEDAAEEEKESHVQAQITADMRAAVATGAASSAERVAAAAASSSAYTDDMVQRRNADASVTIFKVGDLVRFQLRKTLTALDLPSVVMVVIIVGRDPTLVRVWCPHGLVKGTVHVSRLQLAPLLDSQRPEALSWNAADLLGEYNAHRRAKTTAQFEITEDALIRVLSKKTADATELNSSQKLTLRRKRDRQKAADALQAAHAAVRAPSAAAAAAFAAASVAAAAISGASSSQKSKSKKARQ